MKYLWSLLALCLMHGPALADQTCETELFEAGSQVLLSEHPERNRFLKVVLLTAEGTHISCTDQPRTEAGQIRRLSRSVGRSTPLTLEDLISLSAATWTQLARGASLQIAKRSHKSPEDFDPTHLKSIEQLILQENPGKGVAGNLMRSLARLKTNASRKALISILSRSSNTGYQITAARMLAQIKSAETITALQSCSGLNNPRVSAQCKRSLLQYKVRAKAEQQTR